MKSTSLVVAFLLLFGGFAMAYEQPAYEVIQKYEKFELRRYSPYIVAETEVTGAFEDVGNQAFRILFSFISGNNRKSEKIAMTAPVNQSPVDTEGEKIAMTVPVIQSPAPESQDRKTYIFAFVMPSKYTLETLPQPNDSRVKFRQVPGKLMAAHTYSGSWKEKKYRKHESLFLESLKKAGLSPLGSPVYARYNSPFSLSFLRRNEVLVEISDPSSIQTEKTSDEPQELLAK
ncbi:MAG TPA: heme-binding protein [bacterium]|nr:heme-binding protein [bacterium]HQO36211.1 heme-binding protein [bacterium]